MQSVERFRQVFSSTHVVLPVIHVNGLEQALANARIAEEAGADGVFLINHAISDAQLLEIHAAVAEQLRGFWIGVNCLGLAPRDSWRRLSTAVAGLWADDAQIDERLAEQRVATEVTAARIASGWSGLYFGGVAFKYRREVTDLAAAALAARDHVDVVTTSGPGTGHAADLGKIRAMKAALGVHPLAVASGITPENVRDYLPYANCFLVATGISRTFHDLDPHRVARLVGAVRAHDGESRQLGRIKRTLHRLDTAPSQPRTIVRMTEITHGPVLEIDLSAFDEPEPLFAYCDDVGSNAEPLAGLVAAGTMQFDSEHYMWLKGPRKCRLFRATSQEMKAPHPVARLRSLSVGEFCCELYHIAPDTRPTLLWRDDFCLK